MTDTAKVAKFKPAACTGTLGKRCPCGLWHSPGGASIDTESDFLKQDGALHAAIRSWKWAGAFLAGCGVLMVLYAAGVI